MAISLRADNRAITKDAKYSFLLDNHSSGDSTFSVINTEGFYLNKYILVGNIGSEDTEILQIESVTPTTGALTFKNFTDTARGAGLLTVGITNGGAGYTLGDMITVVQGTAENGVVWATQVVAGVVTEVTISDPGHGYTVAAGVATTGGTGVGCTIEILTISPVTSATSIQLPSTRSFIAGQPVTVFVGNSSVVRGTGEVSVTGTGTTLTLTAPGVVGAVYGDTVTVSDVLKFPHAESTKVSILSYNMVRFFRTDSPVVPNAVPKITSTTEQNRNTTEKETRTIGTPPTTTYTQSDDPSFIKTIDYTPPIVFDGAVALSDPLELQVNDFYTVFEDVVNSDGYGWYAFYNETDLTYSRISSPLPYTGFPQNTVKNMFEMFDSSINNKDLRLISQADKMNWLNEGLSQITNELNLGNWEYLASDELVLNIQSGVSKYLLPQNFSDLLFVFGPNGEKIEAYNPTFQRSMSSVMTYAVRGKYLSFYPTPAVSSTVRISFLKNSPVLSSIDDVIDLPNNMFYAVKDYMRFRAYQKLQNTNESAAAYSFFKSQVDSMKIYSIKRDNNLESWAISNSANN